jgi:hypothetical protein
MLKEEALVHLTFEGNPPDGKNRIPLAKVHKGLKNVVFHGKLACRYCNDEL